ncbi:PR-1-like protein [Atractiella rhizophila]|nr:PR-1-like protein [Atractiella rhizophila]
MIFHFLLSIISATVALDDFQQSALDRHNFWRGHYQANNVTWSTTLESAAQTWVNRCVFEHGGGVAGGYGENLAAGYGDITAAIDDWVNGDGEAPAYDPSNPQASHFTQVVWKATTQIGCAVKQCDSLAVFDGAAAPLYDCLYSPPGNVYPQSNFANNVGSYVP